VCDASRRVRGNNMPVFISNNCLDALSRINLRELLKQRKIYIKINMVSASVLLSMTPREAIEETVRFLRNRMNYTGDIAIIEGSAVGGSTYDGFKRLGLIELSKKYDLELIDIHEDEEREITLFNTRLEEMYVPISKTLVNAPFLISLCRAKTHDTVIVTLSIKNTAVGGIVGKQNRHRIHQGYQAINVNIAILGAIMYPNVSIIDGRIGMEGNGPVSGTPKEWGYVIAGKNAVETDAVTAYGMGFDPESIGYLYYLNKLGYGEIKVATKYPVIDEIKIRFKPHKTYNMQLQWRLDPEQENIILEKAGKIINKYAKKSN